MSDSAIERLNQIEAEYSEVNAELDQTWQQFLENRSKIAHVGLKRLNAYQAALTYGMLIKEVLDPAGLEYKTGEHIRRNNYGGFEAASSTWHEVDELHAESLRGVRVPTELFRGDLISKVTVFDSGMIRTVGVGRQELSPQSELRIRFSVRGHYENANPDVNYQEEERDYTQYMGKLAAIDWEPLTEADMLPELDLADRKTQSA